RDENQDADRHPRGQRHDLRGQGVLRAGPMYRLALLAAALLALTGCPRQELYVVLPNADGRPGAGQISVIEGNTTTVLNQPFAAAEARGGQSTAVPLDPTEARIVFNQAIAARPI